MGKNAEERSIFTVGDYKELMRSMYREAVKDYLRCHLTSSACSFQGADSERDTDSRYMERLNAVARTMEHDAVYACEYMAALRLAIKIELGELAGMNDDEEMYSFPDVVADSSGVISDETMAWAEEVLKQYEADKDTYSTIVCTEPISEISFK